MAKQLNVNLAFTADTAKAKAQIAELYKTLNQVSANSAASPNLFDTQKLKEGVAAAKELQHHLNAAVDVNTGKLNLSAFSASLKSSGKSLADYKAKLEALGPAGENAFLQVSKSIATADAPLRKTSGLLKEFGTTLKNTARWQISSSILHGFMGAVQSAYGYTQDLNESLNNIRIVTGNNTEEMARFAKEANRAARALSTTTTEYTNASLIYYQQGLNDQQVKERTDITIKMANVARESAETVSDQLTAVWNNFYENGGQSLEHYADAMTALGAATASSTDEIAGGLEKFASIADMIGLSFDNASAALATITATTRQSEDVVGTALKTIFARIQGLNLGETLDDGTTLNKYSEALSKVGISIYDAAGGLKDMDSILAEMGAKWNSLNKDQQVALAQTVAGVRQYNQLVSLMDNFDFYEQNVMTAKNSDGTLNAQADIYAESWEAASDRVKAAAENIYDSLLDDDFFIKFTNAFGTLLEGIGGFVDGLGGMEGVLSMVGGFITQKLAREAPQALETIKQNLMQISGKAHEIANNTQQENIKWLGNEAKSSMKSFEEGEGSLAYATEVAMLEKIAIEKNKLNQYQDQYSAAEKASAEQEINHLQTVSDLLVKKAQQYDILNDQTLELERNLIEAGANASLSNGDIGVESLVVDLRAAALEAAKLSNTKKVFADIGKAVKDPSVSVEDLREKMERLAASTAKSAQGPARKQWEAFRDRLKEVKGEASLTKEELEKMLNRSKGFQNLNKDAEAAKTKLNDLVAQLKAADGVDGKAVDQFVAKLKEMGIIASEVPNQIKNAGASIDGLKPHVASTSEAIMSFSGALMQMNAFMNSMGSLGDIFKDEDATTIEKLSAVVGALTASFMMFNAVSKLTSTLMALQTSASQASSIALFLQAAAGNAEALATMKSTGQKGANIAATIAQTAANWGLNASMAPVLIVTLAIVAAFAALALIIWGVTAAIKAFEAASPEGQLKAAEEEARAFADALNEAKQEAEDLKNAFDEYNSIQEELDKCTKGTEEWTKALLKANNQVLQLMSDYPELAGMVNEKGESAITNKDGRLEIADWAMNNLEEQANEKVAASQGAYFAAQNVVRDKQLAVQKSDVGKEMANDQYATFKYSDSSVNVSDYVSSLILKNQSSFEGKTKDEISANLTKLFNDNGIIASVDSWTDVVLNTQDDFAALNATVEANTAAVKAQNEALMTSYLSDNSAVQNSEYKDQIISASAEKYDAAYQASYDKWSKTNLAGWFGVGTDAGKEMARTYAETAGLQGFKVTNYRNDQTIDYTYQQEDGTTSEEINISVEAMAEIIAASEALAAVGDNAEALTAKFNQLYTSTDIADHALADFIAYQNLEDATAEEVNDLQAAVTNAGGAQAYLEGKLGAENVTAEMVTNLENSLAGYEDMVSSVGEGMLKAAKKSFDNLDTDSLSISGKEAIANTLEQALVYGGKEGLANAEEIIGSLTEEELGEFSDAIAGIDWNTVDVNSLDKALKDAGITTEFTGEQLQGFIDAMHEAGVATTESLTSRYSEVSKIASDLETGDTISQEDYDTLGEEYQGYFQMMLDGTYKLVGSAEEFQNVVRDIEIGKFQDAMSQLTEQNAQYEKLKGYDIEDLKQSQVSTDARGNTRYNRTDTYKQLEVLDVYGFDPEQIAKWREDLNDGGTTAEVLQNIANAVNEVGFSEESLTEKIQANNEVMAAYDMAIANSYTNLTDLKNAYDKGTVSAQAFNTVAMQLNEAADTADLDPEEWANYADHIQDAADNMADFNDNMSDKEAKIVAKGIMKMNDGIDDLADNFEDWRDILENSTEASEEYSDAMKGTQKAVSKLLDVSEDYVSDDFVKEHLEDIEKAATGDAEAIDRLKAALADQIILDIVGVDKFEDLPDNLQSAITSMQDILANTNIKVGESIDMSVDDSGFIDACNKIIADANMTAEQANAYFDALGFETNFVTEPQTQTQRVPEYVTETVPDGTTTTTDIGPDGEPITRTWTKTRTRTYQDGYYEAEGTVDAIAMTTSTDGSTEVPQIQSITKKATGSSNNYSSSNKGGKPSGGSSSGGGKTTEPVKKERYHKVNKRIDKISSDRDRASEDKDQAFGRDKLKYIDAEIKAIEKLKDAYDDYYDEAIEARKADEEELRNYLNSLGHELKIEDGIIINWDEIMDAEKEAFNNAIGTANEEAAQERWDKVNELIEQYEETVEKVRDAEDKQREAERDRISAELERITTEVDFEIEINQRDLDKLDYIVDKLGRNVNNMIEIIDKLGSQVGNYSNQSSWYQQGITNIKANAAEEGRALTDEEQRTIWEYEDALLGINTSLMDLIETVENSVMEEFNRLSDEIQDNIDRFDTYNSMLDHYNNIIKLSGRSTKDSMLLMQLSAQQTDIAMEKLNATNDKYLAQQEAQKDAAAKLAAARKSGNQADIEYWEKQYEEITKAVEESHDAMLGSWEEVLQAASDQFDLAIELTIQKLKDGISEFGLDGLADRYEKAKTVNEQYLSQLDKEYELNKLIRQVERSIDETDSIAGKQKLLDLQNEINEKMAEGVELSQYDLDYLQAQYDLEVARIALEEAKNAKSTVRLSRDSEGNFGYVYTADQDNIDEAQQNYEDKLAATRQMSEEYIQEMSDLIIQNEQDMIAALEAIDKTRFETKEEYEAEVERITKYYLDRDIYLRTELDKAVKNSGQVYNDTILGQLEDASTWEEAHNNLATNTNAATETMIGEWEKWKDTTTKAMETAGTSSETFTQDVTTDMSEIGTATETLAGDIDTQTQNMITYIGNLMDKVEDWRDEYIDAINQMIAANERFTGIENDEITTPTTPKETNQEEKPEEEVPSKEEKPSVSVGSKVTVKSSVTHFSSKSDNKKMQSWVPGTTFEVFRIDGNQVLIGDRNRTGTYTGWVNKSDLEGFFTGGYTGEWGPEGKLAVLHEKEIVLNAEDTNNLLNTLGIMKDIVSMIDAQANMASLFNLTSASDVMTSNDTLEQTVTIHAEFPNATNHNEIEEAFNNLVNRASQYANRK